MKKMIWGLENSFTERNLSNLVCLFIYLFISTGDGKKSEPAFM